MHNVNMSKPRLDGTKEAQSSFLYCIKHRVYGGEPHEFHRLVDRCMTWEFTPQGVYFWDDVYGKAHRHQIPPETWNILNQIFFPQQQIFTDKEYEELWV